MGICEAICDIACKKGSTNKKCYTNEIRFEERNTLPMCPSEEEERQEAEEQGSWAG